ncbi:hypothetical protein KEM48_010259 [Puccinia striiformis f. sp. tritici PST-130]|nr:hypothetical protein KEM48_010259 [Puccinia striiformis f. sp. tritici PST-130]
MKKNDSDSSDNEVDTDHLESEGSYRYNGSADEPYKPEDPEVAGMDRAEPEVSKEGHMFNESNLESGMGVANKEANLSVQALGYNNDDGWYTVRQEMLKEISDHKDMYSNYRAATRQSP